MPILKRSKVLTAMGAILCRPPNHDGFCVATHSPGTPLLPLILYQRDDCHLCDLALEVLAAARAPDFESVFIDDDVGLEERYGVRVPVLRDDASDAELDWPFDATRLRAWLRGV